MLASLLLAATTAPAQTPDVLVPPGRFASLGTHRLHYHCIGSGEPTVVIDAGLGGSGLDWTSVQREVAAFTRVCTYDRAGYGWSDPGPAPRTTARTVDELRALLASAGETPPFVLVGHSFGGVTVRLMAATHPAEALGLILVESSHPDELPMSEATAHPGRNAINQKLLSASAGELPLHLQAARFLNTRRKALFAQMDELAHFSDSASQIRAAGMVPNIPLIVIARDGRPGMDPDRERHWRNLQHDLSRLAPDGRLVVARGAGHNVHLERPEVVVSAIGRMIRYLRAASS